MLGNTFRIICIMLIVIGAIILGLMGLFNYNLANTFSHNTAKWMYIIIGIAGMLLLIDYIVDPTSKSYAGYGDLTTTKAYY